MRPFPAARAAATDAREPATRPDGPLDAWDAIIAMVSLDSRAASGVERASGTHKTPPKDTNVSPAVAGETFIADANVARAACRRLSCVRRACWIAGIADKLETVDAVASADVFVAGADDGMSARGMSPRARLSFIAATFFSRRSDCDASEWRSFSSYLSRASFARMRFCSSRCTTGCRASMSRSIFTDSSAYLVLCNMALASLSSSAARSPLSSCTRDSDFATARLASSLDLCIIRRRFFVVSPACLSTSSCAAAACTCPRSSSRLRSTRTGFFAGAGSNTEGAMGCTATRDAKAEAAESALGAGFCGTAGVAPGTAFAAGPFAVAGGATPTLTPAPALAPAPIPSPPFATSD
eukprot:Opistho-2@90089